MYNWFKIHFDFAVLEPKPNALTKILRNYPHMHDEKFAQKRFGKAAAFGPLVLPYVQGEQRRVLYTINEYDPLLDSSNMGMADWKRIAEDIMVRNEAEMLGVNNYK